MLKTKELAAKIYLGILVLLITILLRIPNLVEPVWNIDESIYLTIGQSLHEGKRLYTDIYDNKPPLIYYVAYLAAGNIAYYKLILMLIGLSNVFLFFLLTKYLLSHNLIVRFVATVFFTFFISTPVFEGNILNGEILFMLPILTAFYLFFKFNNSPYTLFISGVFVGIAGLVKIPALIDGLLIPLYLIAYTNKNRLPKLVVYSLGVVLPLFLTLVWFFINGSILSFINSAFRNNLVYIKGFIPPALDGLERLEVRLALFAYLIINCLLMSRKLDKKTFIILIWFITSLTGALLSSRPYTHYMLQVIPPITLGLALFIMKPGLPRYLTGIMLIVFVFTMIKFVFIKQEVIGYYSNFLKYITGNITRDEYLTWFGPEVKENYRLAESISSHKDKVIVNQNDIFLLSDNPIFYVLTGITPETPYFVGFHIVEHKAQYITWNSLEQDPPKMLVISNTYKDLAGINKILTDYFLLIDTGLSKIYLHKVSNTTNVVVKEKAARESGLNLNFDLLNFNDLPI